jgi:hypothetical protein
VSSRPGIGRHQCESEQAIALETPVSCRFITLCGRGTCHWWPASCPAEDQHPGDRMIGPPGTDRESPGPAAYRKMLVRVSEDYALHCSLSTLQSRHAVELGLT